MHKRWLVWMSAWMFVACATTPYQQRRQQLVASPPMPTLLTGMVVQFHDSGTDGGPGLLDAAQNAGLDDFGRWLMKPLRDALLQHGFDLTYDGGRTMRMDLVAVAPNAATAALTGKWRHPDASSVTPSMLHGLLANPAAVVQRVPAPGQGQQESYAFVEVNISDGGWLWKHPRVELRASVFDAKGVELLDMVGVGDGDDALFVANRGAVNLRLSFDGALRTAQAAPVRMFDVGN
jgi:hypothetical protein